MAIYPPRRKLPPKHALEIGHIITRWAYVEQTFKVIIYRLTGIGPKEGRVLVSSLTVGRSFQLIRNLMKLRGIKAKFPYGEPKKDLLKIEEFRNAIAHGVWVKHDQFNEPVLQVTRKAAFLNDLGSITGDPKVNPMAFPVSVDYLRNVRKNVDHAADFADKLLDAVHGHLISTSEANAGSDSSSS